MDEAADLTPAVLLTKEQIASRVRELAEQISAEYAGRELLAIGILKGSWVFLADLVRLMTVAISVDFTMVLSYTGGGNTQTDLAMTRQKLYACPSDPAPFDPQCPAVYNVGGPTVNSYMVNGYFVWGFAESQVNKPAETIYIAERRSVAAGNPSQPPYCDDVYHPWWNPSNPVAPENDMDPVAGAIASRHNGGANYVFADTHAGFRKFEQTWSPPNVDHHTP